MARRQATLAEIKNYFSTTDRPVSGPEMTTFWRSLSDAEKDFYKDGVGEILGLEVQ